MTTNDKYNFQGEKALPVESGDVEISKENASKECMLQIDVTFFGPPRLWPLQRSRTVHIEIFYSLRSKIIDTPSIQPLYNIV